MTKLVHDEMILGKERCMTETEATRIIKRFAQMKRKLSRKESVVTNFSCNGMKFRLVNDLPAKPIGSYGIHVSVIKGTICSIRVTEERFDEPSNENAIIFSGPCDCLTISAHCHGAKLKLSKHNLRKSLTPLLHAIADYMADCYHALVALTTALAIKDENK